MSSSPHQSTAAALGLEQTCEIGWTNVRLRDGPHVEYRFSRVYGSTRDVIDEILIAPPASPKEGGFAQYGATLDALLAGPPRGRFNGSLERDRVHAADAM